MNGLPGDSGRIQTQWRGRSHRGGWHSGNKRKNKKRKTRPLPSSHHTVTDPRAITPPKDPSSLRHTVNKSTPLFCPCLILACLRQPLSMYIYLYRFDGYEGLLPPRISYILYHLRCEGQGNSCERSTCTCFLLWTAGSDYSVLDKPKYISKIRS